MEIEMNYSNDIISLSNSLNSSFKENTLLDITERQKRKRRSKNDQEGRMFKCDCGRAYLSALALSNHRKSKHSNEEIEVLFQREEYKSDGDGKKRRGRPKKNSEFKISNFPEMHYSLFFEHELRKKRDEENIAIKKLIQVIFNDVYVKYTPSFSTLTVNEHPFFDLILNRNELNSFNTCDKIFLKYLEEMAKLTNEQYYQFIFKIVILFRDCINKYKNIELENSIIILNEKVPKEVKEFTQYYDAEQVPELCNEFLTEFLESNEFFGINDRYIAELIPIIQHLCYWLYHNNFTSSRLSLVGTN